MSANLGPDVPGVDDFLMPALVLVEDQREAKASLPEGAALGAGLEKLVEGAMLGLLPGVGWGCEDGVGAWTEVK